MTWQILLPAVSSPTHRLFNSLLFCTNLGVLDILQRIQNHLAHMVCQYGVRDHHAIDVLRELHWLLVRSRITFKVAMLCFKAHQLHESAYLKFLIQPYIQACTLHSSDRCLLKLLASRTKSASFFVRYSAYVERPSKVNLWYQLHQWVQVAPFKMHLLCQNFDWPEYYPRFGLFGCFLRTGITVRNKLMIRLE